jgi:hypothetical protein
MSAAAVATAVRERPIIFSAPGSVPAILAGTKTQTRRIVTPQPDWLPEVRSTQLTGPFFWPVGSLGQQCGMPITRTPYGLPGDRLWVRETWGLVYRAGNRAVSVIPPTGQQQQEALRKALYRATDKVPENAALRWRSPRFMPRWASRLTLEILDVRVQRLQEISEEDAQAEGVRPLPLQEGGAGAWWTADVSAGLALHSRTPQGAFAKGWDRISGKRASWASNPWVWALTFRRLA